MAHSMETHREDFEPALKRLFVYGTLMRGEIRHKLLVRGVIKSIVPASVPGELVNFGVFPGLRQRADVEGRVYGEMIYLAKIHNILLGLDAEEGPQYRREIVTVTAEDGKEYRAYAYVPAIDNPNLPVIPSGNWRIR